MRAAFVFSVLLACSDSLPAATLSGQVVEDRAGRPLPSADVRVYRVGVAGLAAELETDSEGRFQAAGLPDGEYRLELTKANHLSATLHATLRADSSGPLVVRLVRCGVISGQVLDGGGQPVAGSRVFALRTDRKPLQPEAIPGRSAVVDERGRYRLFNLPPGQYVVAASYGASTMSVGSMGYSTTPALLGSGVLYHPSNRAPQPLTVSGGEEFRNIDFAVFPSSLYSVSGQVNSSAPKDRHTFWVALAPADQPGLAVAVAIAKADGSFRLDGVPPGAYGLFASGPTAARGSNGAHLPEDALFARSQINVGAQNIEGVGLSPEKGRSVAFILDTPPSGCAAAAELVLTSMEDWGADLNKKAPLAAGKELAISGIAPARYRVSVTGLGNTCYVPESMLDLSRTVPAAPVKVTAVPAGAIQGRLTPGARVGMVVSLTSVADGSEPAQIVTPDDKAGFMFGSLPPGRYRLTARGAGSLQSSVEVDVTGGATVAVELAPPAKGE